MSATRSSLVAGADGRLKLAKQACPQGYSIGSILQTFHYNPELAKEQALEAVESERVAKERWIESCRHLERVRDDLERRMQEVEAESNRKVAAIEWASVRQATEYEDKIDALERQLVDERAKHAEELRQHATLAQQARDEAEARLNEAEYRHALEREAANSRALEAEERQEFERRRAEEEVQKVRARGEARVQTMRLQVDQRVRESEQQKRFECAQLHAGVMSRQKAMEQTFFTNGRAKSEFVSAARAHVGALEAGMKDLIIAREAEMALKEVHLKSVTGEAGTFLELERRLHQKTADRAIGRALGAIPDHEAVPSPLPSMPPPSAASPLVRAGQGALLCAA